MKRKNKNKKLNIPLLFNTVASGWLVLWMVASIYPHYLAFGAEVAYMYQKDIKTSHKPILELVEVQEMSIQEHVWKIMKDEYGLSFDEMLEASAIIRCESNWYTHAINKNKDGSYDLGLWQINGGYHPDISREEAFDVYASTRYAMEIYKSWGSWDAWVCARLLNI